jgi:uncharacterized protein (DUF58 family)
MNVATPSRLFKWLSRTAAPEAGIVVLTQRRIFILPTSAGLLFGGTQIGMLLGCINYNLNLGYMLTFLVGSLAIVSILHTFRNLAQLQLRAGRATPVFSGDYAVFPILLDNPTRLSRQSIALQADGEAPVYADAPAGISSHALLRVPAARRGLLHLGRVRVHTTFPLGLFRAWSNVDLETHCVVYPRPEKGLVPLPQSLAGDEEGTGSAVGQDDFAGLRKYQPGDSLRHVAWKAVARGQPIMTKQFSGPAAGELWLDWDALPTDMHIEARLSRLTRWVLEATRNGQTFGVRLPGVTIAPSVGAAHQEQCLTALALFR